MAFVQAPLNYAKQYSKELANAYPYLNYFGEIYASANSTKYRPVSGNTVMIPSMEVSGAKAVNRDSINGQFSRNFNNSYEPKTMSMYREWDTIVDPMDIVETNDVATIANVTKTFNELQKMPEMAAYCASKLAGYAVANSNVDTTVLTKDNILATWDSYLADMADARINRDRLLCYVTPDVYKLLKEATGLTRFIETTNGIQNVDRNIAKLDGVKIKEVPSDIMKSAYDFTTGFVPKQSAVQVNMILVDPDATVAPIVYDVSMITPPSAATKGKYVYYESFYYDVFSLSKRKDGIKVNMEASQPSM
jgi:hypothetical protein